ncbi:hypothetical protein GPECTOR_1g264 [Gonium pectorale]|uniref:Mitochondrial import inner membrane translocase subunit TIM50 n=1 Tax=Gonium pectorale TaxID=33097 RepID=A0A150H421_GONPE|nr:hypothetical protein GPECTOR_1g264 [Gonium pectorale]|eukprot:KXZ56300.1 hypothetical protein GPECTOR_1g264 [Gonium pectorale]
MTLVLDLDGTLIASEDEPHAPVPFDYCVDDERFVWLRPGLRRFLDAVRPQFEVVLLYRDHTVFHDDWPWVKDLSRLGRDLARVVIVDDNPLMFMYQPDNALHVAAYDPQAGQYELHAMMMHLVMLPKGTCGGVIARRDGLKTKLLTLPTRCLPVRKISGHQDDVLEQVLDVLVHKPHGGRRQRHPRRRRGSGGSGGGGGDKKGPPNASTGAVGAALLAGQGASTHVTLQQAAASALQQPEQQLQLKLRLLQLQREQEEEETETDGCAEEEEVPADAGVAAAAAIEAVSMFAWS